MKTIIRFGFIVVALTAVVFCASRASAIRILAQGVAKIQSTDPNSSLTGQVLFTEVPEGLRVDAEVFNVPGPGEHGFHIHENGSCDDMGKAAGGHFNPMGVKHGFLPKDGMSAAHMGDMGSIIVDDKGHGTLSVFLPGLSLLIGTHTVHDRAVILHEKADDFSQPTGNAGGRIGCGIITVSSESGK